MDYTKRPRYTINSEVSDLEKIYPHDLQMYILPPCGSMPLQEFQELGLDRFKLLRHVEANAARTDLKTVPERKTQLGNALVKDGLKYFAKLLQANCVKGDPTEEHLVARKKDHVSHFIARLSCANDPERATWFVNQEVEFFKLRFNSLHKDGIDSLLRMSDFECKQISEGEKGELREQLRVSTPKVTSVEATDFYKVPFAKVSDLVRGRKAFIMRGKAYISHTDLGSLFVSYFKEILTEGLMTAQSILDDIDDDERVTSFLSALPTSFSGMTRVVWSTSETPIDKLDELSQTSYPLCMRMLHDALRTNHHLKHSGRLQYGLFLKGIGVSLEDSLTFWRNEFTKKMDVAQFERGHTYTIRHNYGKEGRQTNYIPMGCTKILQASVGPGEYHGCPFRHMDNEALTTKLVQYGVPLINADEICSFSKERQYGLACTKYFEVAHRQFPERPIIHPNSYFAMSRALLTKDSNGPEVAERFSQTIRPSQNKGFGTPRQLDRTDISSTYSGTPSGNFSPSTRERTPNIETPMKKPNRQTRTPVRRLVKTIPKKTEDSLNDNEIAKLIMDIDD